MAKASNRSFPTLYIVLIILVITLIVSVVLLLKKTPVSSPKIINATFTCDGGKTIQAVFYNNQVELQLSDGRSLLLSQALSGSGVRYTNWDESVTFWNKGNTAFLEKGELMTYANCLQK